MDSNVHTKYKFVVRESILVLAFHHGTHTLIVCSCTNPMTNVD